MNHKQSEELDKCLELILGGSSLEDCSRQFPDMTPEMHKMLETAIVLMALRVDKDPTEAMNQNRNKLLSQARALNAEDKYRTTEGKWTRFWGTIRRLWQGAPNLSPLAGRLIVISVVTGILILFSGSLVVTSAKSLPGDSLYPVKRAVEDLRVRLVLSQAVRNEYEDIYDQERVSEVESLINLKRTQTISFEGVIESISTNRWVVSGIPVELSENTKIINPPLGIPAIQMGVFVEVEGITNGKGWVSATAIRLRQYQFNGIVDKIAKSYWQISGAQLIISEDAQIDSDLREGDEVSVVVRSEDNALYALVIQRAGQPTSTPEMQETNPITPGETEESNGDGEHHANGKLEQINEGMWVVNAQAFYLTDETHIDGDFAIGDTLEIKYRIAENGAFIAIDIEKGASTSPTEESHEQATPTPGEEEEHHETPTITVTAHDEHEITQTPTPSTTPEPHDD